MRVIKSCGRLRHKGGYQDCLAGKISSFRDLRNVLPFRILEVTTRNSPANSFLCFRLIMHVFFTNMQFFLLICLLSSSCCAKNLRAEISAKVQPPMKTTTVNFGTRFPPITPTGISLSSSTVGPGSKVSRESFRFAQREGFNLC